MNTETTGVVVRRRLLHWRPAWRGPQLDGPTPDADVVPGGGGGGFGFLDLLDDLFAAILALAVIAVVVLAVVPALVLVVEVLVVGLLAALGIAGRMAFGRPWTVEAVDADRRVVRSWEVDGFRRAGRARDQLAAAAAFGSPLPPSGPYDPDTA